jgi:hypothetical protein
MYGGTAWSLPDEAPATLLALPSLCAAGMGPKMKMQARGRVQQPPALLSLLCIPRSPGRRRRGLLMGGVCPAGAPQALCWRPMREPIIRWHMPEESQGPKKSGAGVRDEGREGTGPAA